MKLTTFQQKALEILLYRFQEQKPSEWVTPAEFSMKTSPFDALERKGFAVRRPNPYNRYQSQ